MDNRQEAREEEERRRKMEGKQEEEEKEEGHILRWKSDVPVPPIPNTNFASFLLSVMAQHGGKTALMDASTGKHHTYSDICAMVPRVCAGLAAAGVGAGDAVLVVSPNHIDFPIATLAVMLIPATCVPASPASSPEELAYVVRVSGARWAVVEEGVLGLVKRTTPLLPPNTLRQVWVMGASPSTPSFASLMRRERQASPAPHDQDFQFDPARTVALLPFSSGTTGLPKGVMVSHRNLLTLYFQYKYRTEYPGVRALALAMWRKVLLVLPLYHNYGYGVFIGSVVGGGCLVLMAKFSPRSFLHAIEQYKVTTTPIVPHIANFLVHTPLLREYDVSSLIGLGSGSAPLAPALLKSLAKKIGSGVGEGYGLTETCARVSMTSVSRYKEGSVGSVLPYVEVKIVAPGTTKGLGPGEEGEVWVRGPGVMLGYVTASGEAGEGLKEGGWFPTGDLGLYDQDGFLFLTDRIKDLIKVKGFQVSPSELEAVLREAEGVGEVAVVGVPSPRLGEAPRAWVVPAPGVPAPNPQVLQDYVAARVAPYKCLAGGVELVEALPKNALGKILRRQLRQDYQKATAVSSKL